MRRSSFWKGTTAIILIQTLILIFLLQLRDDSKCSKEKPEQIHILIISSWRSGSSFVGQIFNQHPQVFYLMEPAWHVWMSLRRSNAKVLQMAVRDLLRSVFLCDMSVYDAYLHTNKSNSNLFMWEVSRALCSPPVCNLFQHTDIIKEVGCKLVCKNQPFHKVREACKSYSHVVLKEVRIFHLNALYPLLSDPSLNLKIIHLVRDPRAVFSSRARTTRLLSADSWLIANSFNNNTEYTVIKEVCRSHKKIYETATEGTISFLKDRYMLLRYEDLVKDPITKVKEMYNFAGLGLTPVIEAWINETTKENNAIKYNAVFRTGPRNAVNVSQAWRNTLSFEKIEEVQNICKESMEHFGYRLLESENEQKLMSLDVLLPMNHSFKV
ncbi:carbohydrate sulfotransferase 5-like [Protopterus annectens]|uniref:carbohydrate sulfotransferase 5-like n=1 Tax=Protopterus annectens TaxID=7888 RepID=UPI001CFA1A2C|nr:carbohydrate sulfotransferase 5-like [Protopterus annectens]